MPLGVTLRLSAIMSTRVGNTNLAISTRMQTGIKCYQALTYNVLSIHAREILTVTTAYIESFHHYRGLERAEYRPQSVFIQRILTTIADILAQSAVGHTQDAYASSMSTHVTRSLYYTRARHTHALCRRFSYARSLYYANTRRLCRPSRLGIRPVTHGTR